MVDAVPKAPLQPRVERPSIAHFFAYLIVAGFLVYALSGPTVSIVRRLRKRNQQL